MTRQEKNKNLYNENKDVVYDNGAEMLGSVYDVKDYLCRNAKEMWEVENVINKLENLDETTWVVIYYDALVYKITDYWTTKDKVMQ